MISSFHNYTKVHYLIVGVQDSTLLAGHDKSSKHRKSEELIAQGHNSEILTETEFYDFVFENKSSKYLALCWLHF